MKDISHLYEGLYGKNYNKEDMDARFEHLLKEHEKEFGKKDNVALFSTAGRTELAGNHTDHNLGLVITGTINLDTIAAVSLRADSRVILKSEGFPVDNVDISDLSIKEEEKNTTSSLIRGIADAFTKRGLKVGGFEANTTTRVLKGSGLSSSAAIEVLIAEIFNNLFNNDALSPIELAKISQYAENVYFGKPSGLMDQIGCANGGIVGIDFEDAKNPKVKALDVNFKDYGYNLVIVDTKGNHADLTHEYAAVPTEMKRVAAYFGKSVLRNVSLNEFIKALPEARKEINNDRALLRAYHYLTENQRVNDMLEALENKDFDSYLKGVQESGNSSFRFLQNVYAASAPQEQGLSIGIAISEAILKDKGVVRVHGGGFAGTIQAYVPDDILDEYITQMDNLFGKGASTLLSIRSLPTCRLC